MASSQPIADTDPVPRHAPDDFDLKPLSVSAKFKTPDTPTEETLRIYWRSIRALFGATDDAPYIEMGELERTSPRLLDDAAAPPACGPVLDEIEMTVGEWAANTSKGVMLIVSPPCDENDTLESWAIEQGHEILPAPRRASMLSDVQTPIPEIEGDGLLVIPRLEDWFLRHRRGMESVRTLMALIEASERRCIVGCNSWAWAYLEKAAEADLILPAPLMFEPFGADRLRIWLSNLARNRSRLDYRFRISKSGKELFADDTDNSADADFFETLAARSLGIPWVAWRLWRRMLRTKRGEAEEGVADNGEEIQRADRQEGKRTLWVVEPDPVSIPAKHQQNALLVLHALLVHHRMTVEELRDTVPLIGGSSILPSLLARGVVMQDGDRFGCDAAAYPEIRTALVSAGFPVSII